VPFVNSLPLRHLGGVECRVGDLVRAQIGDEVEVVRVGDLFVVDEKPGMEYVYFGVRRCPLLAIIEHGVSLGDYYEHANR